MAHLYQHYASAPPPYHSSVVAALKLISRHRTRAYSVVTGRCLLDHWSKHPMGFSMALPLRADTSIEEPCFESVSMEPSRWCIHSSVDRMTVRTRQMA